MAGIALVVLATVGVALAVAHPTGSNGSGRVALAPPSPVGPTVQACTPLVYQRCGQPPAPFTDGNACVAGHADYNGIAADGCEATSDYVAGTELTAHQTVRANLVPADAVDSFRTYVHGNLLNFCTGQFKVTVTAPPGVADRVDLLDGTRVLASAVSRDGRPATAGAGKPSCFSAGSTWLTVRVSAEQGTSAGDFQLTRSGGW